tara:strand:+ start:616 stop:798 length:183 start_codon:yes stop_codon:yes gene_type:complete
MGYKLKLTEYLIECDYCDTETHVLAPDQNKDEPEFCPWCGQNASVTFLDGDEDSEEDDYV